MLWHVVARITSANRRIAPLLVSYSFDSDCAQFCHHSMVECNYEAEDAVRMTNFARPKAAGDLSKRASCMRENAHIVVPMLYPLRQNPL